MNLTIKETIDRLLKLKIGLDANTLGSSTVIENAVSDRMNHCGIIDSQSYLTYLNSSSQEWDALIEKVIVPETWFFRDRGAFNFLHQYIVSEWLPNQGFKKLRILSLPCSTGEEPYSIAITLLEAGLTPNKFQIDAVDISKLSVLKAQRGIYGKNSFRGQNFSASNSTEFAILDRYFERRSNSDTYQLSKSITNTVNLKVGNLVDPLFVNTLSSQYQIIFCRNLLIYFDSDSRVQALQALKQLLTPQGLLFVGFAETGIVMNRGFRSVRHPMSFAYKNTNHPNSTSQKNSSPSGSKKYGSSGALFFFDKKLSKKKIQTPIKASTRTIEKSTKLHSLPRSNPVEHNTQKLSDNDLLEHARKQANQGNLQESAKLCQTYLTQNRTSAQAYVLLGEVYQALEQDEQAEQCFQRAVYLDPTHYEALMHLALVKEQRGDMRNAVAIRERIQRLENQQP